MYFQLDLRGRTSVFPLVVVPGRLPVLPAFSPVVSAMPIKKAHTARVHKGACADQCAMHTGQDGRTHPLDLYMARQHHERHPHGRRRRFPHGRRRLRARRRNDHPRS
ncbi:hypothetical protein GCM10010145_06010 [Streptomyces ruber]|uniref:Uncharacterized protein n=2 Tax=Streptomyces TaxID=1883 RepID=A0A918B7F3_9ACTN|nr:hypothetical protein GCM10010145_06010 [Streptomyces ruber]